jgi:hypothetical protein
MAKLESQTKIVVGLVAEPGDPALPWWWQSTTTIQGAEVTAAGYAATESDALLEATATTLDLQAAYAAAREPATPLVHEKSRPSEVEIWAGNGTSAATAEEPAPAETTTRY